MLPRNRLKEIREVFSKYRRTYAEKYYLLALEDIKEEWNPDKIYPKDIFPELKKDELSEIHKLLVLNGFSLDRVSAHVSRLILRNLLKEAKE